MKDSNTVVQEFNEVVNMTAQELEQWLKSDDSQSAGWPKDDGGDDADGESVGHDSGRRIVEILESNPDKDPEKYTEDQVQHMRKVVSYCNRHLAQEEKANDEKSADEVKKTKSYASLKNWGHDPLKKRAGGGSKEDDGAEGTNGDQQAGDKRKAPADKGDEGNGEGPNKKRETEQGESANGGDEEDSGKKAEAKTNKDGDGDGESKAKANGESNKGSGDKSDGQKSNGSGGKGAENGPEVGETVSWNWGNGQPEGKVLDVKDEKTTITTKRGNEVSRDGDPEDPAVVLDTGKSKAIKSAHELND
ncbi:hypothetical protein JDV02_003945 [Purpureocillium takamizusanense]|uniref:Hypervirulence associated protein TUDOR domain-containing protein n=1 Tax=Purpureocillium takamizusanense TaxID=2060973 RepID=A0A9Q8VA85_9HYPO|nr:uncharacterized protein JDV02_003945 [Purpureocillium takamizusanense]UNI17614.1 hypothetical protein JDV02_003945 [Purpureocillium takamizusanense]